MFTKRSLAAVIILSVITFGIYDFFWYWRTIHELYYAGKYKLGNVSTGLQFFFCFINVLGEIVLAFNANENLNAVRVDKGLEKRDHRILFLMFGIFIPIVQIALIQHNMNELAD